MAAEVYRHYARYRNIGQDAREEIQYALGHRRGVMRKAARKWNPACIVIFRKGKPIGWAALFPAGTWRGTKHAAAQVFVKKKHRRKGIGTQLLKRLFHRHLTEGQTVDYWTTTKTARKCFHRALGLKKSFTAHI